MPSLAELARTAGLSAYHFHRVFKAATGVTPKAYAAAHRAAPAAAREEPVREGDGAALASPLEHGVGQHLHVGAIIAAGHQRRAQPAGRAACGAV